VKELEEDLQVGRTFENSRFSILMRAALRSVPAFLSPLRGSIVFLTAHGLRRRANFCRPNPRLR